jgi:hypothetical protein
VIWTLSHRADDDARPLADRHYNRQKIGAIGFVPPGRCVVLKHPAAVWVTSWPFAEYVRHAWPGCWVNSLFRKECDGAASAFIRDALAATRAEFGDPPTEGVITFINPLHVKPTMRRGVPTYGYSYLKAGFRYVGNTKGGLLAFHMPAPEVPAAEYAKRGDLLDL